MPGPAEVHEVLPVDAREALGNYLDADEAFAQIAGTDVATWRQRVEKRSRQD